MTLTLEKGNKISKQTLSVSENQNAVPSMQHLLPTILPPTEHAP